MNFSPLLASSGGFWAPIANPLASVLAFFYNLVPNYGIAIVLLTIVMMIVLTPLTIKQTRSMLVMQKLQPEMKKLQEQHKNDRQALNEAIMALYKEHNASPLGGCLPMLLPFPLFIALLKVLEGLSRVVKTGTGKAVTMRSSPKYLSENTKMFKDIVKAGGKLDAFGMDLAKSARSAGGGFAHSLPFFVLLLVMVGTQFYQQYQLTSKNPAIKSQPGQAMMMKLLPLVFGVISLAFPAGVVLYWTVSNIIRIGQQWALYRYDPKVKALVARDVQEVEAKTREIDAQEAKSPGRPRFRDLLTNASSAAADRRGTSGKSDAKPTGKGAGDKSGTAARAGGSQGVAKSRRPGAAGPQKAVPQKAVPQKAGGAKAGVAKTGGPAKAGAQKPAATTKPGAPKSAGAVKPAAASGAQKAGAAKLGTPQPGPPKPLTPKTVTAKATPTKAGSSKPGTTTSGAAASGAQKAGAPAGSSPTSAVPEPKNGTNGAGTKAPAVPGGNGAGKASTNGDGADAVGTDAGVPADTGTTTGGAPSGNGGAAKGRTGGGSARNVSDRRRRKGR